MIEGIRTSSLYQGEIGNFTRSWDLFEHYVFIPPEARFRLHDERSRSQYLYSRVRLNSAGLAEIIAEFVEVQSSRNVYLSWKVCKKQVFHWLCFLRVTNCMKEVTWSREVVLRCLMAMRGETLSRFSWIHCRGNDRWQRAGQLVLFEYQLMFLDGQMRCIQLNGDIIG